MLCRAYRQSIENHLPSKMHRHFVMVEVVCLDLDLATGLIVYSYCMSTEIGYLCTNMLMVGISRKVSTFVPLVP